MTLRLLVDGPSLIYRAFFAVPKTITDPSGRPVNAVRGFLDMLGQLIADHHPDQIIAVIDADWRPAFRVAAYPGFKANRPEEPQELTPQLGWIDEALDAAGISRAEAAGLEADDVIATLCSSTIDEDRDAIVTGDRDLLCLVRDPNVRLLFTIKGVRQLKVFDEQEVASSYGIPPRAYSDFATLRGDPSDELPGVRGIGPKMAADLLSRFGSLDELMRNLDAVPAHLRARLSASGPYLEAMKIVVPLVADADVVVTESHAPELDRLAVMGKEHNLTGAISRLVTALRPGERL
ncbi:MAG: 5'-3' exonuclease [Actinomycetota bacterium]|nr:5'-3' exonuclease [Actinomycetota bacterium]